MLSIITELNPEFLLACNYLCFKTAGSSVAPLAVIDDLYYSYCSIDFVKEI
jgi:hypothetical protein